MVSFTVYAIAAVVTFLIALIIDVTFLQPRRRLRNMTPNERFIRALDLLAIREPRLQPLVTSILEMSTHASDPRLTILLFAFLAVEEQEGRIGSDGEFVTFADALLVLQFA